MNKLSELSKPVAWLAIYHGDVYDEAIGITRSVVEAQADRFGWESALTEITPLYSQEYVCAVLAELEAKDKRIAELEAQLARFGDVRQHYLAGYDDGHSRGLNAGRLYKEDTGMVMHRHASANAYAVDGDE